MIKGGAQRLFRTLWELEVPTIAAVNGTAAGFGCHLAFACDLVIASEAAKFNEVFLRRGLVPDGGGAFLLPRLIGLAKAKEFVFFADSWSAADAERLGLVNKVVAADGAGGAAAEWADRLAAGPTRALGLDEAPAEPLAGVGPGDRPRRGGPRPGAGHGNERPQGGHGRVHGEARSRSFTGT